MGVAGVPGRLQPRTAISDLIPQTSKVKHLPGNHACHLVNSAPHTREDGDYEHRLTYLFETNFCQLFPAVIVHETVVSLK